MQNAFVRNLSRRVQLSNDDVGLIEAACSTARRLPPKMDLICEGDRPGPVFLFLEGWGCRYKILPEGTRQILAFMLPGDFCDMHTNVLDEMDHSIATVTAALVATIERPRLDNVMERSPAITRAFWMMQLVDLGVARSWIASMGRRSSEARVAHLMCEMYFRLKSTEQVDEDACAMPLSQILLADALGMTPVHLNRVLREFRKRGVMYLTKGTLVIADIRELIRIAGFDDTYLHRRLNEAA